MSDPKHTPKVRPLEQLGAGWSHGLEPLEPLDVMRAATFDQMLRQMSKTAFSGRSLGHAADILCEMVQDEDCFVVMTLSGAMTMAKMGLVIAEMIDQGMVNAIVSTGALMCHGLVEQSGKVHFRYDPRWRDEDLYRAGYARVYDTLELEQNLAAAEQIIRAVLEQMPADRPFGSFELHKKLGDYLRATVAGRGILQSAAEKGVPIYVPAFTDSELGIDLYLFNLRRRQAGLPTLQLDLLRDMEDYLDRALKAKRIGIFTVGGGVPRNWAQQVGPMAEILYRHTDGAVGGLIRFQYGVRICPEPVHWGGLSGCTYSEGVSWGKFVPESEGGRYAEVYADATVAWPILVRGVLERLGRVPAA